MELLSILNLLSDGEFHSGSELGRALGVSRTSVWKALGQLDGFQIQIETVKGKGYRLSRPIELLSEVSIRHYLSSSDLPELEIELLLSVDSTNTYLLQKGSVESEYQCCIAEYQTSGKGRRGRAWISPFARNLYFSLAFELSGGSESLNGLSLVVGISIVKVLRGLAVKGVELKWPNDILLNGKKLAGILVELHGEATTSWRVVIGVGINVGMEVEEAGLIDQPWVSLSSVLDISRNKLMALILEGLVKDLQLFKREGFSAFLSDWNEMDTLRDVEVELNKGSATGVARGVDMTGALLLEEHGVLRSINAGEVSVRRR